MKADRIWETLSCDAGPAEALARELGVSPVTARLLCIRGFGAPEDARRFLSPRLEDRHNPLRLAGMSAAVNRILAAISSMIPKPSRSGAVSLSASAASTFRPESRHRIAAHPSGGITL